MKATFCVIITKDALGWDRIEKFTDSCKAMQLEVNLPVNFDERGRYIVKDGMTLASAQSLRKILTDLGFDADTFSDQELQGDGEFDASYERNSEDTFVVDLASIVEDKSRNFSDVLHPKAVPTALDANTGEYTPLDLDEIENSGLVSFKNPEVSDSSSRHEGVHRGNSNPPLREVDKNDEIFLATGEHDTIDDEIESDATDAFGASQPELSSIPEGSTGESSPDETPALPERSSSEIPTTSSPKSKLCCRPFWWSVAIIFIVLAFLIILSLIFPQNELLAPVHRIVLFLT